MCLEGEISKESVMKSLARGQRASGDLIPWTVSQQVCSILFTGVTSALRPVLHLDVYFSLTCQLRS